jgi:glucan endo-1,3-alpha-glucosidase
MQSAKSIGIDAFAMNWMPPDCQSGLSWQESRIDDAYKAAEEVGFKITHSFDMSWTECNNGGYWNTTYMADVLQKHASSKATYRWNSNMLVTTYGGDAVKQYGNLFFADLKLKMRLSGNAISFTPALTTYSTKAQKDAEGAAYEMIQDFPTTDGYFQYQMKKAGKTGPYIMAVSPWQFKDLDNGSGSDAWVAPGDWLFVKRLEAIAQQDVKPDIIELLTWNDWCESHYLRDLPGNSTSATDYADLSSMQAYVAGQNHSPWRIITKYYISWWKNGKQPEITEDQVVFWYRVHAKDAQCNQGSATIRNSDMLEDAVFAWAAVTKDSTIPKQLNGDRPVVAIMQGGKTAYYGEGSKPVTSWCSTKNFNPVVNLVGQGSDNRGHS